MFNIKGSWCTRRWQTCVFSPNSVCFRNCVCLWQRDAAASRGNDVTYQPISVSKLTFKSTRGPQISTLRGVWRSNYYSENHVTHTSIMIGQQDWWPWQLPLSDSPKRTRGGGGGEEQFHNLTRASLEAEREAAAGKQRERVWNPFRNPFSSINPASSSAASSPPLFSAGHVFIHFLQMKHKNGLHLYWKHARSMWWFIEPHFWQCGCAL